jgi:hypothetical protein
MATAFSFLQSVVEIDPEERLLAEIGEESISADAVLRIVRRPSSLTRYLTEGRPHGRKTPDPFGAG